MNISVMDKEYMRLLIEGKAKVVDGGIRMVNTGNLEIDDHYLVLQLESGATVELLAVNMHIKWEVGR